VIEVDTLTGAQVGSSITVPTGADSMAVDGSDIWVGSGYNRGYGQNPVAGYVSEIDMGTGQVVNTISTGTKEVTDLCSSGTFIWVTTVNSGTLTQINASSASVVSSTVATGLDSAQQITCDGSDVWTEYSGTSLVSEIDASTGAEVNLIALPSQSYPYSLDSDDTDVWVGTINTLGRSATSPLYEIDAATGAIIGSPILLAFQAGQIVSDGTNVWLRVGSTIVHVDAATGASLNSPNAMPAVSAIALSTPPSTSELWAIGNNAIYALTPAISDVSVTPSDPYALAKGPWTIGFTSSPDGAMSGIDDGEIAVAFPPGFTISTSPTVTLSSGFTGSCGSPQVSLLVAGLVIIGLPSGCSLADSTAAIVTLQGVKNPKEGTYAASGFFVSTLADQPIVHPVSGVTINPQTAPSTPTGVLASPLNAKIAVTWTPLVSNGGSTITSYEAIAHDPSNAVVGSCTSVGAPPTTDGCTITGLTNGTAYTVKVKATNAIGTSIGSTASASVTPIARPGAPIDVVAHKGAGQATISWSRPSSDGGSTITSYTVTSSPGSDTCTWTTGPLTCVVTGLTSGDRYTFTVSASNAKGVGPVSVASNSVKPT
jgi:hypothetical protein